VSLLSILQSKTEIMNIRNLTQFFVIVLLTQNLNAQINAVQYQLRFNERTNLFDCFLLIKDGKASTAQERIQLNSQYTLKVPARSAVQIVKSYMPLLDNKHDADSKPQPWVVANIIAEPAADKVHDYISIVPSLAPTGFYGDINTGDEIKLFSINIQPVTNCGADVKIFENGEDFGSMAPGFKGGDFSNGFTLGNVEQIYQGNANQIIPSIDVIQDMALVDAKSKQEIRLTLDESAKYGPLKVEWNGPDGFYSNSQNLDSKLVSLKSGLYNVQITDKRGCKQNKSIEAKFNNGQNDAIYTLDTNKETELRTSVEESIEIFPNPANNLFNLYISGNNGTKVVVDITDMSGKVIQANVLNTVINNNELDSNVDIQHFTPGIYNVLVTMGDKKSSHKLIVIR
jgi:hypothetical protein